MKVTIYVGARGFDLSSHECAKAMRKLMLKHAPCKLDFLGVQSMNHSFVDEFIASAVQEKGAEWFSQNVSMRNISDELRLFISDVIASRLIAAHTTDAETDQ